jgi:hypothetical protein
MDRNQINPLEFARLQNLDDTSEMMLCLRIGWKWNGMLLGHREDNLPKHSELKLTKCPWIYREDFLEQRY